MGDEAPEMLIGKGPQWDALRDRKLRKVPIAATNRPQWDLNQKRNSAPTLQSKGEDEHQNWNDFTKAALLYELPLTRRDALDVTRPRRAVRIIVDAASVRL